jgi:hypothetical protein
MNGCRTPILPVPKIGTLVARRFYPFRKSERLPHADFARSENRNACRTPILPVPKIGTLVARRFCPFRKSERLPHGCFTHSEKFIHKLIFYSFKKQSKK